MDGGAWWATVLGVAKSWTQLSDFTQHHPTSVVLHLPSPVMSISPRSLSSLVVWLRSPSNLDSRDESFKHSTDNLDQWSRIYFIMYIQK